MAMWGQPPSAARRAKPGRLEAVSTKWLPRPCPCGFCRDKAGIFGYFTLNPTAEREQWTGGGSRRGAVEEEGCVQHLRFAEPVRSVMNRRTAKE
jgi:hypothetical protein